MAFSRALTPAAAPDADALTAQLAGIGMVFATEPAPEPNIEDTLLFASIEAMEHDDLRVLAILTTWFGVHHPWVNADRLIQVVSRQRSPAVRTLWAALATWRRSDRRFARLMRLHRGPRRDLLATGTDFHLRRHGEDERFARGPLRVPAGVLRDRPHDVLTPTALARHHRAYRHRFMIGPTYRADMWSILTATATQGASLPRAADLARATYGSFATAWTVLRDFRIASAAEVPRSVAGAASGART